MPDADWLAGQFQGQRSRLEAVAYRMLGSLTDAEDAVQEAWIRLSRSEPGEIENLNGWLTTVVARIALNILQSRKSRREVADVPQLPDPIVTLDGGSNPEQQAVVADAVGLALLVVLEKLGPAERLAFVLHDMFGMAFEEIAPIVERSPAATRQLASRARRRVRESALPDVDRDRQQRVADAFLAAAREGNFEALVAVLHPDAVLRIDGGTVRPGASRVVRGAVAVATGALRFATLAPFAQPVLVNGAPGFVGRTPDGRALSVLALTVRDGRIVEMHALTDPERIARLRLPGG